MGTRKMIETMVASEIIAALKMTIASLPIDSRTVTRRAKKNGNHATSPSCIIAITGRRKRDIAILRKRAESFSPRLPATYANSAKIRISLCAPKSETA